MAIAGAHFAGMLFSGLLSGVLADVRGRRYTLLLGLVCNAFVGVASALARNATQLVCEQIKRTTLKIKRGT